jgi:hypothetical protein
MALQGWTAGVSAMTGWVTAWVCVVRQSEEAGWSQLLSLGDCVACDTVTQLRRLEVGRTEGEEFQDEVT